MKIKIPQIMRDRIDNYQVIEDRLSNYWNENKELITGYASARLLSVKAEYEALQSLLSEENYNRYVGDLDDPNTTGKYKSTLRLTLGYNLLTPGLTHNMVGLYSPQSLELHEADVNPIYKNKSHEEEVLTTKDHLFGVTEVGSQVFLSYKNSGWDIDYMVNEWLPKNLYLWLQVRILKLEHQGDGSVKRGKHTLEEKKALVHYDEVNLSIEVIV